MASSIDPADLAILHQQYAHQGVNAVAKAIAEHVQSKLDKSTTDAMDRGLEQLIRDKLIEGIVKEGDRVPDFELPRADGETLRLSTTLQLGMVVLVFYRGQWCPYCNLHLKALQQRLDEMEQLGAQLVAVSPQTPDWSLLMAESNKLQFPVLSDVGNHVARALGLLFEFSEELRTAYLSFGVDLSEFNRDNSWTLPVPATLIVKQDRTVAKVWADVDYRRRAEPDEVLNALHSLHNESHI